MVKNSKKSEVVLICPKLGYERKFSVEHAESLLSMKNNGGWVLPKNSEFEYIDGTIVRRHTKEDKGTKETF